MRNVVTVARRELHGYFDSPIAYIVVVSFLLVAGWMFFSALFLFGRADMRPFFAPSPFSPSMLLVILAPAITMRLIAEERKTGTIELLTTMPVRDAEVVLGKFVAAVALLGTALLLTVAYPITISMLGPLDWGPVVAGYLGMLLFVSCLVAVGLLCSTLTENQIVAFIVAFIVSAALYYVYWLQFFVPQLLAPLFEYLSVSFHLDNMARGVIDSRDVLFYLTLTAGALFLAVRSLERQHA
jgi:ABC-2 type transport system permease protein